MCKRISVTRRSFAICVYDIHHTIIGFLVPGYIYTQYVQIIFLVERKSARVRSNLPHSAAASERLLLAHHGNVMYNRYIYAHYFNFSAHLWFRKKNNNEILHICK